MCYDEGDIMIICTCISIVLCTSCKVRLAANLGQSVTYIDHVRYSNLQPKHIGVNVIINWHVTIVVLLFYEIVLHIQVQILWEGDTI